MQAEVAPTSETVGGATIPVAAVNATTVLIIVIVFVGLVCRVRSSNTFLQVTSSYLPATNRDKKTLLPRIVPITATFCWESHTVCSVTKTRSYTATTSVSTVR